jgi:hypothetical protein
MVLFAVPFPTLAPGALLTGRPTQAASNAIKKTVAIAEKVKLVAEIANVRAGRKKLFMVWTSPRFVLIEQPLEERRRETNLRQAKTCFVEVVPEARP